MKKSLVALAVLAATGAYAQSSVTLYGIVEATTDIGYNRTQDTTTTTNTFNAAGGGVSSTVTSTTAQQKNGFRIQDGSDQGSGSSRVGFRGTEDLGGGLKANFLLEMGLRIDDGCTTLGSAANCDNGGNSANSGGSTFGRNAWGGLSGGFGEVRLGRQVLGSFAVQGNSGSSGASNGLYDASTATMSPMGGIRFSNAIRYLSPNFGGFTGSLMLAAPETGSAIARQGFGPTSETTTAGGFTTTNNASRRTGVDLALEYANGPAYVGFGYNKRDTLGIPSSTNPVLAGTTTVNNLAALGFGGFPLAPAIPATVTGYTIGGAYDLGVVKPFINYTRQKTDFSGSRAFTSANPALNTFDSSTGDSNQRALSIGLRAPVGAFTVIAGYGRSTTTSNAVVANTAGGVTTTGTVRDEAKRDAFQLGAQYALSKRTLVEANYGYNKLRGNSSVVGTTTVPGTGRVEVIGNSNDRISALNVGLRHSF